MSLTSRRNDVLRWTAAERAIQAAVDEVERAGAHPLLTDAVVLLSEAQARVADYVDGHGPRPADGTTVAWCKDRRPGTADVRCRLRADHTGKHQGCLQSREHVSWCRAEDILAGPPPAPPARPPRAEGDRDHA